MLAKSTMDKKKFEADKSTLDYSWICQITKEFDRNYDNTVVDSYAFDYVLKSEGLSRFIYCQIFNCGTRQKRSLASVKKSVYEYIIAEVGKIYEITGHIIVNEDTYLDYINSMFDTMLQRKREVF